MVGGPHKEIEIMKRTLILVVVALLTALTAACDGFGSNDRQQAASAQQEADRAATEAHKEAAQAVAEGVKKTAEARAEANAEAASAQAGANDKIRAAKADIKAADVELRAWAQKELDGLDHHIDGAKVKAQTAKPAKLDDFKAGIIDVEAKRDTLASDIGTVSAGDDTATAKVKLGIDERIDGLKARIDALSKKL
jgi:predicted small secreted protein